MLLELIVNVGCIRIDRQKETVDDTSRYCLLKVANGNRFSAVVLQEQQKINLRSQGIKSQWWQVF